MWFGRIPRPESTGIKMSESFAELFEESLKTLNLQAGSIITAIIVDIDYQAGWVTVHAGLKSEGLIPHGAKRNALHQRGIFSCCKQPERVDQVDRIGMR
jgi:hypothetical protein